MLEHLVLNHVSVVSGCICVLLGWDESRQEIRPEAQIARCAGVGAGDGSPGERKSFQLGPMEAEPDRFHEVEAGPGGGKSSEVR